MLLGERRRDNKLSLVSSAVAADLTAHFRVPASRVGHIYNPVEGGRSRNDPSFVR